MSKKSEAAALLGRLGGRARAAKHSPESLAAWSAKGGEARRNRHTPEELKAFAKHAGRKPWKVTPKVRKQILAMIAEGHPHKEIAARFGISLRTITKIRAESGVGP